jgi:membrane protease YdiL (CAAX protease family)
LQNYARPNKFQYFGDILILIGLALICGLAFGLLGKMFSENIFKMSFKEFAKFMRDNSWMDNTNNMKLFNVVSTFGACVVSGFLLLRMRKYPISGYWRFQRPVVERTWLLLPFLFISCIFVASALLQFNYSIDIPQSLKNSLGADTTQRLMDRMLVMYNTNDLLLNLFVIAFIPALFEEIFFRGTLQPLLIGFTGSAHAGIIICALIFAAIHQNIMQIIPMFFLALVLGYLIHYTKSLIPGIIIHFCNNALAVLAHYYSKTSDVAKKVAEDTYVPGIWEILLFSVILAGIFFYFHKKAKTITADE